jgi:hypothetical protein
LHKMHELRRIEVPCQARINADNPGGRSTQGMAELKSAE